MRHRQLQKPKGKTKQKGITRNRSSRDRVRMYQTTENSQWWSEIILTCRIWKSSSSIKISRWPNAPYIVYQHVRFQWIESPCWRIYIKIRGSKVATSLKPFHLALQVTAGWQIPAMDVLQARQRTCSRWWRLTRSRTPCGKLLDYLFQNLSYRDFVTTWIVSVENTPVFVRRTTVVHRL